MHNFERSKKIADNLGQPCATDFKQLFATCLSLLFNSESNNL